MAGGSARSNPASPDGGGEDQEALYDAPAAVPLTQLAPGQPWVAIAATADEASALAARLPAEGETPRAIALDEPGWRPKVALLPPDCGVAVLVGSSGAASLPVLRMLAAHRGMVLLVDDSVGAMPLDAPTHRLSRRGGGALLVVDADGPAVVYARRRRAAPSRASADRRRRRVATLAQPGARLAAVGPSALAAIGGATWPALVDHDRVDGWAPEWAERGGPCPDVVLLDATVAHAQAVRDSAAAMSVRVLSVDEQTRTPVVEPTVDNPVGWVREPTAGPLDLGPGDEIPSDLTTHQQARVHAADADPALVATLVVRLAARGLPVVLSEPPAGVIERLGGGTRAALDVCAQADLADVGARERASVALRRAALAEHGADGAARDAVRRVGLTPRPHPSVSVLLATRRREFLDHAIAQVAAQRYPQLELVLIAHGPGVAEAADAILATQAIRHVIVDADPGQPLGAALNAGVAAASGQVVTKMDDDDWYGPHHVGDCVAALRYSGAPLVGKGAEFCWLAAARRTVRRNSRNAERYHAVVSGASLAIARDDLDELGGWAHQSRAVDRRLVDAVERSGERTYRLHGFEFCVNRHEQGSTWTADTDYFLRTAEDQWPGRALARAGIDG